MSGNSSPSRLVEPAGSNFDRMVPLWAMARKRSAENPLTRPTREAIWRRFEPSGVLLVLFSTALASHAAGANRYTQHNLVSDIPGIAEQTDPNLVNPWVISMSSTSPFWISNNHTGIAAVYDGQGKPALTVKISVSSGANPPAAPTGQVFNDTQGFNVSGKPATFIFATEDGEPPTGYQGIP